MELSMIQKIFNAKKLYEVCGEAAHYLHLNEKTLDELPVAEPAPGCPRTVVGLIVVLDENLENGDFRVSAVRNFADGFEALKKENAILRKRLAELDERVRSLSEPFGMIKRLLRVFGGDQEARSIGFVVSDTWRPHHISKEVEMYKVEIIRTGDEKCRG